MPESSKEAKIREDIALYAQAGKTLMCLCIYQTFTFSNRTAFKELDHALSKLSKQLKMRCYPQGTVYIILAYAPKQRERLPYKELVACSEIDMRVRRIHFSGWEAYEKVKKRVGKIDVFGKVWVKIQ